MRKTVLWGLTAAMLAGAALMAIPGDGHAQLFNSSKKEQTEPAPSTAKGGTSGGTAPLFNSGNAGSGGAKPLFLDPSVGKNAGGKAKPFSRNVQKKSSTPGSNNGFNRKPGAGDVSEQDRAIREATMRRLDRGEAGRAEVQASLDALKAQGDVYLGYDGPGMREDRRFGAIVPQDAPGYKPKDGPSGPMVYDKHKNTDNKTPNRLFNPAQ